jgi:hypothetical protein
MIPVAGDLWTNRFFPCPKLFQGIRAIATDADWSAGDGLYVTGPIEALVLTLVGRFAAIDQLQGDGIATCVCGQMLSEGSDEAQFPSHPFPGVATVVSCEH